MLNIPHDRVAGELLPHYLTAADHPWLGLLLSEYERFVGRRRAELARHLETPLPVTVPRGKLRLARGVLDREYRDRTVSPVAPAVVRRRLFTARAQGSTTAQRALEQVGRELSLCPEALQESLFADVPGERRLVALAAPLSPTELALRVNHATVCSLLKRATRVELRAEGQTRALVRAVKLRGLLCTVVSTASSDRVELDISGPYALFRRTLVYGRSLASLLPRAARCQHFELRASCALSRDADLVRFKVRSGDPVIPAAPLPDYDSKVEQRFARDFRRLTDDWDLLVEPRPVAVGEACIFPDFAVRHRRWPGRDVLLEIVGFWTPEYLEHKLARLRQAGIPRLILCVDAQRGCSEGDLPQCAEVVWYRRRVPAREVLERVEVIAGSGRR